MPVGANNDSSAFDLAARKCVSIAYDAKFNVLVEAAGDEGLRFRQCNPEARHISSIDYPHGTQAIVSEVLRYLNVPTSHIAFTPFNMMLCCHRNRMCMVRHCTGQLVYETTLDCASEIGGVAFDSSSDTFYVCDSVTGCVTCMQYMEFHKSRKLDLKYNVLPSGLCIFSNVLLIPNKNTTDAYCGLYYKLDDSSVYKINRVQINRKLATGKQQKLAEAVMKNMRPTSLNGLAIMPHPGSQQSMVIMVGISEIDHSLYKYNVRLRKMKEGASCQMNLVFKLTARDDLKFVDRDGNVRLPRSIAAISSEYVAVYYEVSAQDKLDSKSGIMLLRLKQPVASAT